MSITVAFTPTCYIIVDPSSHHHPRNRSTIRKNKFKKGGLGTYDQSRILLRTDSMQNMRREVEDGADWDGFGEGDGVEGEEADGAAGEEH